MQDNRRESQREASEVPATADFVIQWSVAGRYGYCFTPEPVTPINERAIIGTNCVNKKFLLMGGQSIERTLSGHERTIDEALGSILNTKQFENSKIPQPPTSSSKYRAYLKFNGKDYTIFLRKLPEVLSEDEVLMVDINNVNWRLRGDNLELYCCQLTRDEDGEEEPPEPLDLRLLGAPIETNTK